jgi:hypothetical protein
VTPVTKPLTEPIVATDGKALIQVPPGVASVSVVEEGSQYKDDCPAISAGSGFTVIVWKAIQPEGKV